MEKIGIIEEPFIQIPKQNIFRRLGFGKNTELSKEHEIKVETYLNEAYYMCEPKSMYGVFPLDFYKDGVVINGEKIKSKNLAKFLSGYDEALMMVGTVGAGLVKEIKKLMKNEQDKGVVFDAVGSELTDSILDSLQQRLTTMFLRQNKKVSKPRYSFGYGDASISNQKWYFKYMKMEKLGIILSESNIMYPEKSVTAVAGIKNLL